MYKKIMTLCAGILMTGCSNVHFDNVEYDKYITFTIRAKALSTVCKDDASIRMGIAFLKSEANYINEYASHRAARDEVKASASTLYSLTSELFDRYESEEAPSQVYCEQKLKTIATTSEAISSTLGRL